MRNPFQSETDAFRFLLATVGAFAAIAVASLLGGVWAGVPVWIALTAAAAVVYLRQQRHGRELRTAPARHGDLSERNVLVLADGVATNDAIVREVHKAASGSRMQVLVVCSARVSGLDHWTSAVDSAREQAQQYLDESLAQFRKQGIATRGEIGDEDPLRATEDALRTFPADEIIIVTPPLKEGAAGTPDVVAGAREHFALPIKHVVVEADEHALAELPT